MLRASLLICCGALLGGAAVQDEVATEPVDFARQVRPILVDKCFGCHGPDETKRERDLRLDMRVGLFDTVDELTMVVPGDLEASELWSRVSDVEDPMPPEDSGVTMSRAQRETIKRWIEEGAVWSEHWAFEKPLRPDVPELAEDNWSRNDIDRFVLARLKSEGLEPRREEDRASLLRRVSFDLTGLPPTLDELDDFLASTSEKAYEEVVDRLMASPRYGERKAQEWLDLARYADSNGDGYDGQREMWKWRDWVVEALNSNQPFDQFTIEQLAGDLLPNATRKQRLATGFNRNHAIFTKAGAKKDEYRHAYVVDRVNTTSTVWMGLTLGCVQCHDHKYDPFSQKEYYGLYAYFNNVTERDVGRQRGNTPPYMVVPDEEDGKLLDELELKIAALDGELSSDQEAWDADQGVWAAEVVNEALAVEWTVIEPTGFLALGGTQLKQQPDGSILATGPNPQTETYHVIAHPGTRTITALRLEVFPDESHGGRVGRSDKGTFNLSELEVYLSSVAGGTRRDRVRFVRAVDDMADERSVDGDKAADGSSRSGWSVLLDEVEDSHEAIFFPDAPLELNDNAILRFVLDQTSSRRHRNTIGRFRLSYTEDEQLLRRHLPVLPGVWRTVGPFAAEDTEQALAQVFEPEKEIATGVDLGAQYDKVELKKGRSGARVKPAADKEKPAPEGNQPASAENKPTADKAKPAWPDKKKQPKSADESGGKPKSSKGKPRVKAKPAAAPEEAKPAEDPPSFGGNTPPNVGGNGGNGFGGSQSRRRSPKFLTWQKKPDWRDGGRLSGQGKNSAWYMHRLLKSEKDRPARVLFESTSGLRVWLNGEQVFERENQKELRRDDSGYDEAFIEDDEEFSEMRKRRKPDYEAFDVHLKKGENHLVVKAVGGDRGASLRLRVQPLGRDVVAHAVEHALLREARDSAGTLTGEPVSVDAAGGPSLEEAPDSIDHSAAMTREWYRRIVSPEAGAKYVELDGLRMQKRRLESKSPYVMVLDEGAQRETHVLLRGAYNQPGEKVERGVPAILPPLPVDAPNNRLGLAKWLVSGDHPLTARVAVNHLWRQYFGMGFVDTANDFGTRGALPTHPELLDWLAIEFVESGWDVKGLHKSIVMSATYRQVAKLTPELHERDPANRLFARGPRLRLSAEMIRDNALSASGLLVEELGGESVKPFQPSGLWQSVGGSFGSTYRQDKGEKLYRRGLYVFWKRGVLYPSMALFDAPTRATCSSERIETNTPLQSLVLLNDPVFVESARGLGERMMKEGGVSRSSRLTHGFRLCTSRMPTHSELAVLLRVYAEQVEVYSGDEKAAKQLISVGDSKPDSELKAEDLAAWTAVASLLLNLDATIHRN